jgi:hypothetical protein
VRGTLSPKYEYSQEFLVAHINTLHLILRLYQVKIVDGAPQKAVP